MVWLEVSGLLILAGLGIILPVLIHRQIIISRAWTRIIALAILILVAALVTGITYFVWNADPGVIFTRVFLVDGISLYILNNAPATKQP